MDEKSEQAEKRFILWAQKDGPFRENEPGLWGEVGADSFEKIRMHLEYPSEKRPLDLRVGESIRSVRYRVFDGGLYYDIIRIR